MNRRSSPIGRQRETTGTWSPTSQVRDRGAPADTVGSIILFEHDKKEYVHDTANIERSS